MYYNSPRNDPLKSSQNGQKRPIGLAKVKKHNGKTVTGHEVIKYNASVKNAEVDEIINVNFRLPPGNVTLLLNPRYRLRIKFGLTNYFMHPTTFLADVRAGLSLVIDVYLQQPWRKQIQKLQTQRFRAATKQAIFFAGNRSLDYSNRRPNSCTWFSVVESRQ